MIDRWKIPEISVISTKSDRVAGLSAAISEISLISYGVRTENRRMKVVV